MLFDFLSTTSDRFVLSMYLKMPLADGTRRSLTIIMNSHGPSFAPCETPAGASFYSERQSIDNFVAAAGECYPSR